MKFSSFPTQEDDRFEFKSSQTALPELKKKLERGVAGFANSGGGVFVVGIDDNGNADGGVQPTVGRTSLRDWVDQVVQKIEPNPEIEIYLLDDVDNRGTLTAGNVILAVETRPSSNSPHMASDGRYYIRAGAHTLPARHFLLEAIWSRRYFSHPKLIHVARIHPWAMCTSSVIVEIMALNDSPALNVCIKLDDTEEKTTSVIDKQHSFSVGFDFKHDTGAVCQLSVTYSDLAGNQFTYQSTIDTSKIDNSYTPMDFNEPLREIARTLDNIERKLN